MSLRQPHVKSIRNFKRCGIVEGPKRPISPSQQRPVVDVGDHKVPNIRAPGQRWILPQRFEQEMLIEGGD